MIVAIIRAMVSWLCTWSWKWKLPTLLVFTFVPSVFWSIVPIVIIYFIKVGFYNSSDGENKSFKRAWLSGYLCTYTSLVMVFIVFLITGCTLNNTIPGNMAGEAIGMIQDMRSG